MFAQTAPPEVDAALRARIAKFYQVQIDGKPRLAEPLVAEESKDVFYAMNKPRFLSFSIDKIEYSEKFTQAKATVTVKMYLPVAQFSKDPVNLPIPSLWKIEDGLWCWYVDPNVLKASPFGTADANPNSGGSNGSAAAPPDLKRGITLEELLHKVKADKTVVNLRSGEASAEQVSILNQMPGPVTIELHVPQVPGLEVQVDRHQIPGNEKATLSFTYKPGGNSPKEPVPVEVQVEPVHSVITLQVTFH